MMTRAQKMREMLLAQKRLKAKRQLDYATYLECWLHAMESVQIAELKRIHELEVKA